MITDIEHKMKSDYLDEIGFQLSHDLKGSLRAIALGLDLISRSLDHDELEKAKDLVVRTRLTAIKLQKLLDGLTGLSIAGQARADENLEMSELVAGVLPEFEALRMSKNIEVTSSPMPSARGDFTLLEEVWRQLIDNSLRYGVGSVHIGSIPGDHNKCTFFIENEGPHIPSEIERQLFSSMVKGENSDSGVGLGLVFCRRVIERLGGKIEFERINDRNRFSFELS
jgi:signal transduction histidine kinase